MSEQLAAAADRLAAGRQRLIEVHAVTARLIPGKQRDRLNQECLRMIRDFPDLGLGCDLDAQLIAIQALEDRIRTALATIR